MARGPRPAHPARRVREAEHHRDALADGGFAYRDRHRLDRRAQRHSGQHLSSGRRADHRRRSAVSAGRSAATRSIRSASTRRRPPSRSGCGFAHAGKKVVTATWPGGDGVDVRINNVVVQSASPTRVVNYTVPFGAFGGIGATGFTLTAANFAPDAERRGAARRRRKNLVQPGARDDGAVRDVLSASSADDRDLRLGPIGDARSEVRDARGGARHDQRRHDELRHAGLLRDRRRASSRDRSRFPPPARPTSRSAASPESSTSKGPATRSARRTSSRSSRPTSRRCASPAMARTSFRATRR